MTSTIILNPNHKEERHIMLNQEEATLKQEDKNLKINVDIVPQVTTNA